MFSTWERCYWLGGAALGIVVIVTVVMNPLLSAAKQVDRRGMGLDFVAFYTAGTFAREGRGNELYDLAAVAKYQKVLASGNAIDLPNTAPWWNPPVYAFVLAPLSAMNFRTAYWTWLAINAMCLAGAVGLLGKLLPGEISWQYRTLLALLVCVCMPSIQAMGHAQNSAISLLLLTGAVVLAIGARPILAGSVLGMLLYKPQIAVAAAIVLGVSHNWRLWIGFAAVAVALVVLNMVALPGTMEQYVFRLGENLHAVQFGRTYLWERQVTLGGFWRLLLQGRQAGEKSPAVLILTVASQAILAGALGAAWWRTRKKGDVASRELFTIAALTAMPLLLPYYLDYDLLLLAVPATLYAARSMSHPPRVEVGLWTALYVWLLVNPGVGRITHVNLAVPLLSATAVRMLWPLFLPKAARVEELDMVENMRRLAA